jgi:hypothetical protein
MGAYLAGLTIPGIANYRRAKSDRRQAKQERNRLCLARLLFIARGLLFFCQLVVPDIFAQAQLTWQGFGLANADFTTFVQKFLNKRIIRGFFGDMFHEYVPTLRGACLSPTIP